MTTETKDYKFDVTSPAKIIIKNIRGKVNVKKGADGEIKVQVIKYLDTGNSEDTLFEVTQESDGSVLAAVDFENLKILNIKKPCRIDFIVETPQTCQVKVKSVSGEVQLEGVDGNHNLKTVSGGLEFSKVRAEDITAKTVSGSILGNEINSSVADIGTVSGSIKLSNMNISRLDVSSVSGSMSYDGILGDGRHDFGSVSGNIKLIIPEDTNLDLKASSISGKLKSDLNIKYTSLSKRSWIGKLNNGGSPIKLKTVSGNMRIEAN